MWFRKRSEPAPDPDLRLVVGLGNPERKYAETRHNLGARAVAVLARRQGLDFRKGKQPAEVARGSLGSAPVLFALPLTYMNESGIAVSRLVRYYRVPLEHLLVVCDDIDLPFGRLRFRPGGSSGGNNGLKSIIAELGTEQFPRLRLGVGRPRGHAVPHVLGRFSPEEEAALPRVIDAACEGIETAVVDGIQVAMNRYNRDWLADGAAS